MVDTQGFRVFRFLFRFLFRFPFRFPWTQLTYPQLSTESCLRACFPQFLPLSCIHGKNGMSLQEQACGRAGVRAYFPHTLPLSHSQYMVN